MMNFELCEAIIPYYDELGQNCTYVLLKDGTKHCFKMTTKTYLRRMFSQFHIDLTSLNYWTYSILHKQQCNPLLLNPSFIFLPVRMRKVVGRADGCIGYVLNTSVTHIEDYSLELSCGAKLSTLSKASYLRGKQKDATLLHYTYTDHFKLMAWGK